jgi:hypothetical protein
MASISPLSPADRLLRRSDLVVRPVPELRMCMVYRPKPSRIITLNATGWMLFELCNGSTIGQIEHEYCKALASAARKTSGEDAHRGLNALLEHELVQVCKNGQCEN